MSQSSANLSWAATRSSSTSNVRPKKYRNKATFIAPWICSRNHPAPFTEVEESVQQYVQYSKRFMECWRATLLRMESIPAQLAKNPYFITSLYSYEQIGVAWLLAIYNFGANGILADEIDQFKPIQLIAFYCLLQQTRENGPHLICMPLPTAPNWLVEFNRAAPNLPVIFYHGNSLFEKRRTIYKLLKGYRCSKNLAPIIVVPHYTFSKSIAFLRRINFASFALSFGDHPNDYNSPVMNMARTINCQTKYLLTEKMVSGTRNLWPLLNFLSPSIFANREPFDSIIHTDQLNHDTKHVIPVNGPKDLPLAIALYYAMEAFVFLTHREIAVNFGITRLQANLAGTMHQNNVLLMRNLDLDHLQGMLPMIMHKTQPRCEIHAHMGYQNISHQCLQYPPSTTVTEITKGEKMQVFMGLVRYLVRDKRRMLIISSHMHVLDLITGYFYIENILYERLDSEDGDVNYVGLTIFNNNPYIYVFLMHALFANMPLQLMDVYTLIFIDCLWDHEVGILSISKCYRFGQTLPPIVYSFLTGYSLDEYNMDCGLAVGCPWPYVAHEFIENSRDSPSMKISRIWEFSTDLHGLFLSRLCTLNPDAIYMEHEWEEVVNEIV